MNPSLSIRIANGMPIIVAKKDDMLFMLLSAKGAYTRRGHGLIKVLEHQYHFFHVIADGNGADGDTGRIGHWDCRLISVAISCTNAPSIIQVRPAGGGYGIKPTELYLLHNKVVYKCTATTIEDCCNELGIQMPFQLSGNGDGPNGICSHEQWIIL